MGSMLEKPITAKDSASDVSTGSSGLAWASCGMQGWRPGMEDAHICIPEMESPWTSVAMFGVLDGHGGEQVAKFCERHLPEEVHSHLCTAKPWAMGKSKASPASEEQLRQALTSSFHLMDELLRSGNHAAELKALTNPPCKELNRCPPRPAAVDCDFVGCTCNICCITDEFVLCANAGDSRAVLCRGGKAVALSEDHKPNDDTEERRIKAAGGWIETQHAVSGPQYRVCGNLNLSRALGDLKYKKDRSRGPEEQIISGTPDFLCERRSSEDEFLVLCCDGVWDVKTNQEVVDFVRSRLPAATPTSYEAPVSILEELLDSCVSPDLRQTKGLGGDNMTAVLVRFPPPGAARGSSSSSSPVTTALRADRRPANFLGVQVEAKGAGTGNLVVRLGLQAGSFSAKDISLGFCERMAKLEVAIPGQAKPQQIPLQDHVPPCAVLRFPSVEPAVKYCAKTGTLRVVLQWRYP